MRFWDELQPVGTNDESDGTRVNTTTSTATATRKRRILEAFGWALLIAFLWGIDTLSKISERANSGFGPDDFHLYSEQLTSGVAVLVMVIFVVYWTRLFPLRKDTWVPALIGHTAGSLLFAFGHFSLTVLQRIAAHVFVDHNYRWREDFAANLIVEYQKDIKIYLAIVAILTAYRYYRRTQDKHAGTERLPSRLVVQTGSGDAILSYGDILYLEAARNYVDVHTGTRSYLIRDTIAKLEERLADGSFVRCHRSFIVNLEAVAEIQLLDGAHKILLKNGTFVPLSRGYRSNFEASLQA